jgi:hypothetical protein
MNMNYFICLYVLSIFVTVVYELDKECENDGQCSEKLGEAVCVNYHCQCREGARLNEDKKCSKFHDSKKYHKILGSNM